MKHTFVGQAAFLGVALALLLAFAQPAAAVPPEIERLTLELSGVSVVCDGFNVNFEATVGLTLKFFFNRDGDLIGVHAKSHWRGTSSNSVTGASITDNADFTEFFDLEAGGQTTVGLLFRWIVPGQGVVYLDVGRLIFDASLNVVFAAGQHDFHVGVAGGGAEGMCDILG